MLMILYSVDPRNWIIMDIGLLYTLVDIITGKYIYKIKYSTYTGVGETDGNRYDVIFIMVIFLKCHVVRVMISPQKQYPESEVSCGVRNDKSPKAVACTPELVLGRARTHYKYEPSDLSVFILSLIHI